MTRKLMAILMAFSLLAAGVAAQTGLLISGTVLDNTGEPMPGATVILVSGGKSIGATADLDGKFELHVGRAPSPIDIITASFIGYKEVSRQVGTSSVFNFVLEEDNDLLEESVVVGYGVQRKIDLTGSVSAIKDDDLVVRPVMRATAALSGLAAGVTVTQNSGQPGSDGATIRIHGIGTLNDSDPLVLVDGVSGSLDAINPNDIESISILKDAASAAIYGSRAANGVILVTTKSGSSDNVSATYHGYAGFKRHGHAGVLVQLRIHDLDEPCIRERGKDSSVLRELSCRLGALP